MWIVTNFHILFTHVTFRSFEDCLQCSFQSSQFHNTYRRAHGLKTLKKKEARCKKFINHNRFCFQWVPEITHHCQKTPFLLVGTQIDLRDDATTVEKLAKNRQKPITLEMGEKLAKELKAVKYVECSALTQVRNTKVPIVRGKKSGRIVFFQGHGKLGISIYGQGILRL